MNRQEINEFIEKMEEVGDVWTEEQVNDVYGDSSFEDALADRQSSLDHAEPYKKAIRLCAENGVTHMSNYLLYNGDDFTGKGHNYHADTPEDLYERS